MVTPRSNADIARDIYAAFSRGDLHAAVEFAADNVEVVFIPTGQVFRGHPGFDEFIRGHKTAFPDIRIEVSNQVAAGDDVINEFIAHGTHTGPLATPAGPIPPTGRAVTFTACEVQRFRDGKLVSLHNYQDLLSVLRQLGVMGDSAPATG